MSRNDLLHPDGELAWFSTGMGTVTSFSVKRVWVTARAVPSNPLPVWPSNKEHGL